MRTDVYGVMTSTRSLFNRLFLLTALAVLSSACASQPAATPVPSATVSLTPLDTPTASLTPSITPSPTIVHIPTQDPNLPTATFPSIPIFIGNNTATPSSFTLPTPIGPGPGFVSVEVVDKKIYWGSCKPNKTQIIAKVENPGDVFSVIIFVQVKSATKEDSTPWTTGNSMQRHGGGVFTYLLTANTTEGHNHYKNSWIRFQLAATDDFGEVVGRTRIFTNEISLSPCMGL